LGALKPAHAEVTLDRKKMASKTCPVEQDLLATTRLWGQEKARLLIQAFMSM